jgi:hypothetical protein
MIARATRTLPRPVLLPVFAFLLGIFLGCGAQGPVFSVSGLPPQTAWLIVESYVDRIESQQPVYFPVPADAGPVQSFGLILTGAGPGEFSLGVGAIDRRGCLIAVGGVTLAAVPRGTAGNVELWPARDCSVPLLPDQPDALSRPSLRPRVIRVALAQDARPGQAAAMTIRGWGFAPAAQDVLGTPVTWRSPTELAATVPVPATPGPLSLQIYNGTGAAAPYDLILSSTLVFAVAQVPMGQAPSALAAADVDQDGLPDLAIGNAEDATVWIELNRGDGSFGPPAQSFFIPSFYLSAVAFGRFDEDQYPDLAVLSSFAHSIEDPDQDDGNLVVLRNQGGSFSLETGSTTYSPQGGLILLTGDLDGDGLSDIAIQNDYNVSVLLNRGLLLSGKSQPTVYLPGNYDYPSPLVLGPLRGQVSPDLVFLGHTADAPVILRNRPDMPGTFAADPASTNGVLAGAKGAAALLPLGTGAPALLVGYQTSTPAMSLARDSAGLFTAPVSLPGGAHIGAVAATDINGDGHVDLVATNLLNNDLTILLNHGDDTFPGPTDDWSQGDFPLQPPQTTPIDDDDTGRRLLAEDLNGDCLPDIVVTCAETNQITVLLNMTNARPPCP